jgi:hypothetical protein
MRVAAGRIDGIKGTKNGNADYTDYADGEESKK